MDARSLRGRVDEEADRVGVGGVVWVAGAGHTLRAVACEVLEPVGTDVDDEGRYDAE